MQYRILRATGFAVGLLVLPAFAPQATAQLVLSANDGKAVLVDGVNTVPIDPKPDNVTIIDLGSSPPKVVAEIKVATSVVGPPSSVAVARDESFALVTAATKIDPSDSKKTAPDNKVSVIDLKASPPAVIAVVGCRSSRRGIEPRWQPGAGGQSLGRHGVRLHDSQQGADSGWQSAAR